MRARAVPAVTAFVASVACSGRTADHTSVVVTVESGSIFEFAGDESGVAWGEGDHGHNRIRYRPTGGAILELGPIRAAMNPVAVDGDDVYWSDDAPGESSTIWRWSRTSHRAEVRARLGGDAGAILSLGGTLWVGAGAVVYQIARDGDASATPVGHTVAPDEMFVRDLVVLDGRVAAVARRYGGDGDAARTVVAWADGGGAPLVDVPWASSTAASDGHTLYLCDWSSVTTGGRRPPINVWSMTAGHALALVPDISGVHDVALNLHGADAGGLYLSDGTTAWRRAPDGSKHRLGRRLMHGVLDAGVLYGTRSNADRGEELVRLDLATTDP